MQAISLFKRLMSRTPPEERFWTWFAQNSRALLESEDFEGPLFDELTEELEGVEAGLVWEMGIHEWGREIIISADGNRNLFPTVEKMVAAAPRIEGWKVVAFRPRKALDLTLQIGDLSLKAENISYMMRPGSPGKVSLDIYIDDFRKDDQRFIELAFIFLDAALGEYDMETKVADVNFDSRQGALPNMNLRPFGYLPVEFDSFFGKTPDVSKR
jgi:hypothetical protein